MNDYLAQCVDGLREPTLPQGMTAVEAVAELGLIRQEHRTSAAAARRYAGLSTANGRARESALRRQAHHEARRDYATALIRRFRREAKQS